MRQCVAELLQTLFGDFNPNGPVSNTQVPTETNYTISIFLAHDVHQKYYTKTSEIKEDPFPDVNMYSVKWPDLQMYEALFEDSESNMSRLFIDQGWISKEEYKTGKIKGQQRYSEVHAGLDYLQCYCEAVSCMKHGKEFGFDSFEAMQHFLNMVDAEKSNPGQFIELKRQYLGIEAQTITVLKYPAAKTWDDCLFSVLHTKEKYMHLFDDHLQETLNHLKQQTNPQDIQNLLYKFDFLMSAQTRYFRGSSAIKEWFVSALYRFKEYEEPTRLYCETDQFAQILTLPRYVETLSEKDGSLKPLKYIGLTESENGAIG
jgi:hypothetical protein